MGGDAGAAQGVVGGLPMSRGSGGRQNEAMKGGIMGGQHTDAFSKLLEQVRGFDRDRLIARPEWGSANFQDYKSDFDNMFFLIDTLGDLPYDILPDTEFASINENLDAMIKRLNNLDRFDVSKMQYVQAKTECDNIRSSYLKLLHFSAQWIPFLSYKKGDIQEKLSEILMVKTQADSALERITKDEKTLREQSDAILSAMRDASSSAGVAHFSEDFKGEAASKAKDIAFWGYCVLGLGVLTVIMAAASAVYFIFFHAQATGIPWLAVSSKFILLAILFSATAWCGRMYKAEKHQLVINSYKAHALRTFQAFSNAAPDDATKSAVLLETTKAIFGAFSPGYIDNPTTPSSGEALKIFELIRPK